jgi:hypothetical protein
MDTVADVPYGTIARTERLPGLIDEEKIHNAAHIA